jgi:ParB family chromosome partitioning protein
MSLKLPTDLAAKIGETLNWKIATVNDYFEFNEDKEGYFWAQLKPKRTLEKPDFIAVCKLTRGLGGEDYLKAARAWKIPGPLAKKAPAKQGTQTEIKGPRIQLISLDSISIPTFLPTRTLISHERLATIRDSMKKYGQQYPIKVRPGAEANTYELIDGYLRYTSAQQLSWKEIQAEISERSDEQVLVSSIITNKDRIEEDPITLAKKLNILINAFGWTQEKLAQELGIDRSTISNYIRLLKLPEEIQHCLALNNVSFFHALQLLTLETPELQTRLAKEVIEQSLSTRELQKRILEVQPKEVAGLPEKPKQAIPFLPKTLPLTCTRCGEVIEGRAIHLGEGKYYDAECAEQEVAESKAGIETEEHPGPFEEAKPEKESLKAIQIGSFECTECHQHFLIEHLLNGQHKLRPVTEAPS